MGIVYLNGEFIEQSKAMISVMDRGFLFGDGVYDAIPVYNYHPFRIHQHLERLFENLQKINLTINLNLDDLQTILTTLIQKNKTTNHSDYYLYLQISRGADQKRQHTFPSNEVKPTVFATCLPHTFKTVEQLSEGITAITTEDLRWRWSNIKSTSMLANVLHCEKAKNQNADEAILIQNNLAIEGAKSNLFIVDKGEIFTPPSSNLLVSGITRQVTIECAEQLGIPLHEKEISKDQLFCCDEIWLTGSSKEIMPITKLDSKLINQGKAGPIWYKMIEQFQKNKTYQKVADTGSNIDFPCDFHIKVMGKANDTFKNTVFDLLKTEFPDIKDAPLDEKLSKNKNYLSLNITVHLNDKDQLNRVYQLLKDCPEVLMSL